jgi:hypothetical protein
MTRFSDDGMYSTAIMEDRSPVCRIGGCGTSREPESEFCAEHGGAVADVRSRLRQKSFAEGAGGFRRVWVLDEPDSLGALKTQMKRAGVTQRQVASVARCSASYVNSVLSGLRTNPAVVDVIRELVQQRS